MPPTLFHTEGANIRALCITTGKPVPLVSMYVDNTLLREVRVGHLAASIFNVSRHMKEVSN